MIASLSHGLVHARQSELRRFATAHRNARSRRLRRRVSAPNVAFICLFAAQAGVLTLSPILPGVAREFEISTAAAGQLRTLAGLSGGIAALAVMLVGARVGLRQLLLAGNGLLALGSVATLAALFALGTTPHIGKLLTERARQRHTGSGDLGSRRAEQHAWAALELLRVVRLPRLGQAARTVGRRRAARKRGDCSQMVLQASRARLSDELVLADGTCLRSRSLRSDDRDRLAVLFARLTPKSPRRRFLSPKPALTTRELVFLTDFDHLAHETSAPVDQRDGSIVGAVRYVRAADRPGMADVAVEVIHEKQKLGVSTALAARLLDRARANGITLLAATTLWENRPARALLQRLGFRARTSHSGEIELELELNPNDCRFGN